MSDAAKITTPDLEFRWYYAAYYESDYWEVAASRDEAIAKGQALAIEMETESFFIGEAAYMALSDAFFDADEVCEQFEEHNEMAWGEDGPDRSVSKEAMLELTDVMTAAFAAWRTKHAPWSAHMLDEWRNQEEIQVEGKGNRDDRAEDDDGAS